MVAIGFDAKAIEWLDATKYVKIRAGATHRFVHVWIVIVEGRVFARSWNDKPEGWFAAFRKEREGAIEIGGRPVPVKASIVTSARILDAVTSGFGKKYTTKANEKYVVGFAEKARRANTVELLPK